MEENKIAPGGQVTGNDKEDIAALLKQAIQEASGNNKEEKEQNALKMTIGGEEREFKSIEEMQTAINSTLETYQRAYAELAGNIPKQQTQGQEHTNNKNNFDKDTFINKMNEDPVQGFKYALKYALFDGQVEDPGAVVKASAQKAIELENQLVAYQFRNQQPELANMLSDPKEGQKTLNTLTGVMRELGYNSLSVPGLEAGYAVAIQRGLLKPPTKQEEKGNNGGGAPPLFGRSGGFDGSDTLSDLDKFANMPYDQRVAFLARLEGKQ